MVVDAVRTYLDATSGLNELTRKRAVAAAKSLIRETGAGEDAPGEGLGRSIQALAAELIETSQSNRDALGDLVRAEVAREMERRDMVPRAEYDRLARRVAELERRLASVRGGAPLWTRSAPAPEPERPSSAAVPGEAKPEAAEAAEVAPERAAEPDGPVGGAGGSSPQKQAGKKAEDEKAEDEAVGAAAEGTGAAAPEDSAPEAPTASGSSASESGAADTEAAATADSGPASTGADGQKPASDGGDKDAEEAAKRKTPAKKGTGRGKSTGKSTGKRTTTRSRSGSTAKKGD